jgi:hypothetical protein
MGAVDSGGFAWPLTGATQCTGVPAPLQESEMMTPDIHWSRTPEQRVGWYNQVLQRYDQNLHSASEDAWIPMQLVATAILNEMIEIDEKDVTPDKKAAEAARIWQYVFDLYTASLGIAQIEVSTAREDKLLALTPGDFVNIPGWAYRAALARKLTIRECSILACSRELRLVLDLLIRERSGSWASQFGLRASSVSGNRLEIYEQLAGADQKSREMNLAELVIAAYNSTDIAIALKPGERLGDSGEANTQEPYYNARTWGKNARRIAGELFEAGLFRDS